MHELVGGRYRLDEHIGNGGMAEVWRATDDRTGATVAVKRLHPRLAHDPTSQARFSREVDAARAIDHPSAVRVLDAGDGVDGGWLAMDYLAGGSLADRLRTGPLPAASVAAIGADVAEALVAIGAAGLVHRDVKPSNILLDEQGGARLADFGIARGDAADGLEDVTATGDMVGTLRFMPPEVLAGGPATAASDVWALGAVLYEALTGRPPFDASSPAALVASQRARPARPAPAGDRLGDVLVAMLERDPAARPAANEVAQALRAVAQPADPADEATVVIPAVARPGATRGAVPEPPVLLATVPAAVAADPAAPPAGRPRSARRLGLAPAGVLAALLLVAGLVLAVNGPFGGQPDPAASAPAAGAGDVASPVVPAASTPAPTERATPAGGSKGKDNGKGRDKPDKPGKGKGG